MYPKLVVQKIILLDSVKYISVVNEIKYDYMKKC